jgi:hypothetical protein
VSFLVALALLTVLALPSAVLAQEVPGGGGWTPGPGATGDNTYQGFVDEPQPDAAVSAGAPLTVRGWVVDTAAEGWAGIDGVQVLQGDRVLAQGSVGIDRPDVAAGTGNPYWTASGFSAVVPGGSLTPGSTTLTVAAHTPGKGTWMKQVPINVGGSSEPTIVSGTPADSQTGLVLVVQQPAEGATVFDNKNGAIYGIAYDTRTRADLGAGADRVQVYLDGARGVGGSQFIGEAVPTGTTWSVAWEPTRWNSVPHHVLWIYGRSAVTGEEKLVQREIIISKD